MDIVADDGEIPTDTEFLAACRRSGTIDVERGLSPRSMPRARLARRRVSGR
jgi:hypothetical protein